MEHKHIITVGDDTYIVHLHLHDGFLGGAPSRAQADVYDSVRWEKVDGSASGHSYSSGSLGGHTHEELNDVCRKPFTMTVCWRGCWDEGKNQDSNGPKAGSTGHTEQKMPAGR